MSEGKGAVAPVVRNASFRQGGGELDGIIRRDEDDVKVVDGQCLDR